MFHSELCPSVKQNLVYLTDLSLKFYLTSKELVNVKKCLYCWQQLIITCFCSLFIFFNFWASPCIARITNVQMNIRIICYNVCKRFNQLQWLSFAGKLTVNYDKILSLKSVKLFFLCWNHFICEYCIVFFSTLW